MRSAQAIPSGLYRLRAREWQRLLLSCRLLGLQI
jgi:hypothetical protein